MRRTPRISSWGNGGLSVSHLILAAAEGEGGEGFYIAQSGRCPDLLVIGVSDQCHRCIIGVSHVQLSTLPRVFRKLR
jgi:hypothetical protein